MESFAEIIIRRIIADLTDRSGLRQEWEEIDERIQQEIVATWTAIVDEEITRLELQWKI